MSKQNVFPRRIDFFEFRGLLALTIVLFSFSLAIYQLYLEKPEGATIPPWVTLLLGSITSTYFVSKTGERTREIANESSDGHGNTSKIYCEAKMDDTTQNCRFEAATVLNGKPLCLEHLVAHVKESSKV